MSYDALMRWEWEGGAATPGNGPRRAGARRARRRTRTVGRSRPTGARGPTRVASVSPVHSGGWQGDGTNADRQLLSRVVLVLASLAAVLAAAALATALLLEPPTLGWIGFAVISLIVFAIGVAATLAVPRLRVSPLVPAVADDRAHRLLVVADAICGPQALSEAICGRDLDDVAVHLVVPVRVSRLHFLTEDESRERRQAEVSLARTLRLLHELWRRRDRCRRRRQAARVDDRRAWQVRRHSRPARDPARTRVVLV